MPKLVKEVTTTTTVKASNPEHPVYDGFIDAAIAAKVASADSNEWPIKIEFDDSDEPQKIMYRLGAAIGRLEDRKVKLPKDATIARAYMNANGDVVDKHGSPVAIVVRVQK